MSRLVSHSLLWSSIALLGAACGASASSDPGCEGDSCDLQAPLTCKLADRSGFQRDVNQLDDPIAKLVLRASSCPGSLTAVQAALEPCSVGNFTVSELGQLTGEAGPSRQIMPGACEEQTVFLSPLGEKTVEAMGLGTRDKLPVFNFYKLESGAWSFLGDSIDLLAGPGPSGARACATCHVSGAPIMKELRLPWVHWQNPDRHLETLETKLRGGIDLIAGSRLAHLRASGTVEQMLEPLFCTHEFNLATARGNRPISEPEALAEVPMNLLSYRPVPMNLNEPVAAIEGELDAAYRARLAAADVNQRVESSPGSPVRKDGEVVRDLLFPLIYPETAAVDQAHVQLLVDQQIVSQRFVDDVTQIDFTRPVFSDQRCALLELAPDLPAADATPTAIVDGFRASLNAKKPGGLQPAEAELLASLEDGAGDDAHRQAQSARIQAFDDACRKLSPEQLVDVAIKAASQLRAFARESDVIEMRAQMPVDDLDIDPARRLDAATCTFR